MENACFGRRSFIRCDAIDTTSVLVQYDPVTSSATPVDPSASSFWPIFPRVPVAYNQPQPNVYASAQSIYKPFPFFPPNSSRSTIVPSGRLSRHRPPRKMNGHVKVYTPIATVCDSGVHPLFNFAFFSPPSQVHPMLAVFFFSNPTLFRPPDKLVYRLMYDEKPCFVATTGLQKTQHTHN